MAVRTWLKCRLAQGLVDYDELLVARWDAETQEMLDRELPELLRLDLQYAVHLPMTNAAQAWDAYQFFEERQIPILNYVLHPMPHWREYAWGNMVSIENLKDIVELHQRMVFDVGHHLLGRHFPDAWKPCIVEVHAMGVQGGHDHLALDAATAGIIMPWISGQTLVTMEVFDLDALKDSIRIWEAVHA